jgi:2-oxoacid:acceptor oxidoreductase delta subunit (pyruvate/2-ketoisovalerate family)
MSHPGGVVLRDEAEQPQTGAWRPGLKPQVDLSKCVNCLLCWLYCPDSAISLEDAVFTGFDLRYCKGCELCAAACPTGAVTMVEDRDGG